MDETVTTTVVHEVAPGREADFHAWASAMLRQAESFPGFRGGGVLGPAETGDEWHVVYRWVDQEAARRWEGSSVRARWLARAAAFAQPVEVQRTTGLRAWFEMRGRPATPPPKWKMALVTLAAVFPPVLAFNVTLIPFLRDQSVVLRTLALCVVVTAVVGTGGRGGSAKTRLTGSENPAGASRSVMPARRSVAVPSRSAALRSRNTLPAGRSVAVPSRNTVPALWSAALASQSVMLANRNTASPSRNVALPNRDTASARRNTAPASRSVVLPSRNANRAGDRRTVSRRGNRVGAAVNPSVNRVGGNANRTRSTAGSDGGRP